MTLASELLMARIRTQAWVVRILCAAAVVALAITSGHVHAADAHQGGGFSVASEVETVTAAHDADVPAAHHDAPSVDGHVAEQGDTGHHGPADHDEDAPRPALPTAPPAAAGADTDVVPPSVSVAGPVALAVDRAPRTPVAERTVLQA